MNQQDIERFKVLIENQIEGAIAGLFVSAHHHSNTTSGDISPEQSLELDRIKSELSQLIFKQVFQNLEEEIVFCKKYPESEAIHNENGTCSLCGGDCV